MNCSQIVRTALTLGCAVFLIGISEARACGVCSPEFIKKVGANLDYPDALHVEGKVWAAQKAGRLPKPDMKRFLATGHERHELDRVTMQKTVAALNAFGTILAEAEKIPDSVPEGVSVLLVDEMMWNQFTLVDGKPQLRADIEVQRHAGLVMVTESVVVGAIARGDLTIPMPLNWACCASMPPRSKAKHFSSCCAARLIPIEFKKLNPYRI